MSILEEIAARRKAAIAKHGETLGVKVPESRQTPLTPFCRKPLVICEIKRGSPSRGKFASGLVALDQARLYLQKGVKSLSILTETDYFFGSLTDLIEVKKTYPQVSVLRKDFLLTVEDIDVSHRAGADAILLIAKLLDAKKLAALYYRALKWGLTPLVEVHDQEEINKVEPLRPALIGINSRNLSDFTIDPLLPLAVKQKIPWSTQVVYESGILSETQARLPFQAGFVGILVGEGAVKKPDLLNDLFKAAKIPVDKAAFWTRVAARLTKTPLVKICGLTNQEDVTAAIDAGADLLGFVFAPSPRRAKAEAVKKMRQSNTLKVAVVTCRPADLPPEIKELLDGGFVDAVQFHGHKKPLKNFQPDYAFYQAAAPKTPADHRLFDGYRGPRLLIDAWRPKKVGGSGCLVNPEIVALARERGPLWLAGGLNTANITDINRRFRPELVDAASGLEREPGYKDHAGIKTFCRLAKESAAF